jgi:hypothetical protein
MHVAQLSKNIGTGTGLNFHGVRRRYVNIVHVETKKAYRGRRSLALLGIRAFLL